MSGGIGPASSVPDLEVKLAVYRHFAATGMRPTADQVARDVAADVPRVMEAYGRLSGGWRRRPRAIGLALSLPRPGRPLVG